MPDRPSSWTPTIVGGSLFLLLITFLSYPLAGRGLLSVALFMLGFGGERNVGAWWSAMLFFFAGVLALDRAAAAPRRGAERRGWAALAAALALLSLDELASLHEWLSARGSLELALLGAVGLALVVYALVQLHQAKVRLHSLLLAFALLGTVPVHELVQNTLEWNNAWVYGARAFFEEGTEIAAALLLVAATSDGFGRLGVGPPKPFFSFVEFGTPLAWLSLAALPVAYAAGFALDLTGPANWLGSALFLSCALLAVRAERPEATALYLLASLGVNALSAQWAPVVFGQAVSLRGLFFGALLTAAAWLVARNKSRRARAFWLALAASTLVAALVWPRPDLLWSTWPPTVALLCFFVEVAAVFSAGPATKPAATVTSIVGSGPSEPPLRASQPPAVHGLPPAA